MDTGQQPHYPHADTTCKRSNSEEWLRRQLRYLADCERHRMGLQRFGQPITEYEAAAPFPPFPPFPTARWFLTVYVRDVCSRLPALLALATSVYGSVLKIDSTKKICKKLQGSTANTASWATIVGNEKGEMVISVLTESESIESLQRLVDGLMDRYERANQEPPPLLYTDRDCCSQHGPSQFKTLFSKWDAFEVRLEGHQKGHHQGGDGKALQEDNKGH